MSGLRNYLAAVVTAWEAIPAREKPTLIVSQPKLYFAVARLAAAETVRAERRLAAVPRSSRDTDNNHEEHENG